MSAKQIVASCAVMAVAIAAGSWYAVQAFPLQGAAVATAPTPGQRVGGPGPAVPSGQVAGPLERQAKPTTPENPIPRRTSSVPVELPAGASPDLNALVELRATIDQQGRVAELRATRAVGVPPEIVPSAQAAAIDAVKQWQYDAPAEAPISFGVTVLFNGTGIPVARQAQDSGQPGGLLIAERLQIGPGGVTAFAPVAVQPTPPGAVRVGGAVRQPMKTRHVNPVYPPIAQSARVQGVVIVEAVIGADGNVQDARILRSIPLLDEAALDAVRQWAFTPTLLNGAPTPVIMTVTVQFSLPEPPEPVQ